MSVLLHLGRAAELRAEPAAAVGYWQRLLPEPPRLEQIGAGE